MTRLEFIQSVGEYEQKRKNEIRLSIITGIALVIFWLIFFFFAGAADCWNRFIEISSPDVLVLLAGGAFGNAIRLHRGTKEHQLISSAIRLMYLKDDSQ